MMTNSGKRIAVVVIHGMGNQFPMDTLRGFVNSLQPEKAKLYSSPNRITGDKETRRLSFSTGGYDFYEYYWAHYIKEPPMMNVLAWSFKLLFSKKPSERIKPHLGFVRGVVIGLFIVIIGLFFIWYKLFAHKINGLLDATIWGSLLVIILGLFKQLIANSVISSITKSVGDVINYTLPSPENIETRDLIRKFGIELVENLHNAKNDNGDEWKYRKVIVVAHSLGSIVAYDILTSLFAQYHKKFSDIPEIPIEQLALKNVKNKFYSKPPAKCEENKKTVSIEPNHQTENDDDIPEESYQELQNQLYKEYRKLGHEWRVSNFITLGAPLTHAHMILSRNENDFVEKKELREFPTCPPQYDCDDQHFAFSSWFKNTNKEEVEIKTLHHAAHFASTQWTNIYFEKDWIGGPLAKEFGEGINDIKVTPKNNLMKHVPLLAHTRYWDMKNQESINILHEIFKKIAPL